MSHGLFDSIDTAEGVFNQLVFVAIQNVLKGFGVNWVLGEPVWDRSLVAGICRLTVTLVATGAWSLPSWVSALVTSMVVYDLILRLMACQGRIDEYILSSLSAIR